MDRKYRKEELFGKHRAAVRRSRANDSGKEGGSGNFKARKISKLTHRGFYVTATFVVIQECTEKAGTQRKMLGTINNLSVRCFSAKVAVFSFGTVQYFQAAPIPQTSEITRTGQLLPVDTPQLRAY